MQDIYITANQLLPKATSATKASKAASCYPKKRKLSKCSLWICRIPLHQLHWQVVWLLLFDQPTPEVSQDILQKLSMATAEIVITSSNYLVFHF